MKINLWYCDYLNEWRWTATDDSRPILKKESGQKPLLKDAMRDAESAVKYMLENKQSTQTK